MADGLKYVSKSTFSLPSVLMNSKASCSASRSVGCTRVSFIDLVQNEEVAKAQPLEMVVNKQDTLIDCQGPIPVAILVNTPAVDYEMISVRIP